MSRLRSVPPVMTGLLCLLAAPSQAQSPQPGPEPKLGSVDRRAVTLMARVEAKMRAARSIETIRASSIRRPFDGQADGWRSVHVWVQRPDRYRVETIEEDSLAKQAFKAEMRVSDGKQRLTKGFYSTEENHYFVERTADDDIYVWDDDVQTLAGLYVHDDEHPGIGHDWRAHKLTEPTFRWIRYLGPKTWNGKTYQVVEWAYDIGNFIPSEQVWYRQQIYVGADTLAWRVVTTTSRGFELEDQFRSLTLNPPLADTLFAVTVPVGAKSDTMGDYPPQFRVGDTLPEFTAPLLQGDSISLTHALQGKKGGILWFWGFR